MERKKKSFFLKIAEEQAFFARQGKDKYGKEKSKKEKKPREEKSKSTFCESIRRHGYTGPSKMKPRWTTSDGEVV